MASEGKRLEGLETVASQGTHLSRRWASQSGSAWSLKKKKKNRDSLGQCWALVYQETPGLPRVEIAQIKLSAKAPLVRGAFMGRIWGGNQGLDPPSSSPVPWNNPLHCSWEQSWSGWNHLNIKEIIFFSPWRQKSRGGVKNHFKYFPSETRAGWYTT